jgi:ABC-type uncharacterized transport system permease subunit
MYRYLIVLLQPGVITTGLVGTALQLAISFANSFNIAGAADTFEQYGLSGQLASGGLIAALTGAYYAVSRRRSSQMGVAGAGIAAGGISGALGTALSQSFGWTEIAAGTTPLLNFSAIATAALAMLTGADTATATSAAPLYDPAAMGQVLAAAAAGGGAGAFLGHTLTGGSRKRRRAHA